MGVISTCRSQIATKASTSVSNVNVTLSPGSVAVNYVITVSESAADAVATNLQNSITASSNSMMTALLSALNQISGIGSVTDGTLAIADVSTPAVSTDNADAATMGASSVYTAVALAMAAFVTAHAV